VSSAKPPVRWDRTAPAGETPPRIALIGYGEVGQTLAADFAGAGMDDVSAWDTLFPEPSSAPSQAAAVVNHVRVATSMADALAERTLVISAVTAGSCLAAAREAATSIASQAFYFDLNSVSPRIKREAAALIEAAGARFVEAAVMSPVAPKRTGSPILIGGCHAEAFAPLARAIGFTGIRIFAANIGRASAAKMCRSVLVKGLEALLAESLLAARRYGVEHTVLESLHDLFPNEDWDRTARYMISRSLQHGRRRAEEMQQVARTVAEVGIEPLMSLACAQRQAWSAAHRLARDPESLTELLDAVLTGTGTKQLEPA
jgi:3-hydroxyisobutyrate dehydrogenase-like beta-hydroxyacid dehydrogenase